MMRIIRKRISELSSADLDDINSFLDYNFSTIFHEPSFNSIVSEVFNTQFFYSLAYGGDRRLIALCPLHYIKRGLLTTIYSNPTIYSVPYGGWVYDRTHVSLHELMNYLKLSSFESLKYWSSPQIENNDFSHIKNKKEYQTGIINLTLTLDEILQKNISKKRRQAIKRSSRQGIIVEELTPESLNIFIEQCGFLRIAVGLKVHPPDYFIKLFNRYYVAKKIVALASKLDGNYLASGLLLGNKKIMHLWIAGRAERVPQQVRRTELLLWEALKYAKNHGSKYFDLCVVEQDRLPGIAQFKLDFTKNLVPFYCISDNKLIYRIISRTQRCF